LARHVPPPLVRAYGQSFMDPVTHRFGPGGLYLLDEPEAPPGRTRRSVPRPRHGEVELVPVAPGRATGGFEERLTAFARSYVEFATRYPALLALMFARKDDHSRPKLREANERAFAAPIALVDDAMRRGDIVSDEPDRVAMAVLAVLQGLASIITAGMIADRSPDTVVTGTVKSLVDGLRPR